MGGTKIVVEALDTNNSQEVADFHRIVLASHFRPDELESLESLSAGLASGGTRAAVAKDQSGGLIGGVVGDWFTQSRVLLISYLAVVEERRSGGIGTELLTGAMDVWSAELEPRLIVGEVEDPRFYPETDYGDPHSRIKLYERLGARTLPVPYFQPGLGRTGRRVPHLLLMVASGGDAPEGAKAVDGAIVERFLAEFIEVCEGPTRDDDVELQSLLTACRVPGGLPLLLVKELLEADRET